MRLHLPARPPFNFLSTVRSHGWYQLAPLEWDDEAQVLRKPELLTSGQVVMLTVTGDKNGITVKSEGGQGHTREAAEIAQKMTWMFALDKDLSAFYALAALEPRLAHCVSQAHGRLLRSTTVWEDVVRTLMTTNIQWSGTKRLVKQLVTHFGEPARGAPGRHAFPAAAKIARSHEATVRKLGFGYRAPYLLKLAKGVASGEIDLDALRDPALPAAEVRQKLIALPGIGPYAAATLLGILGHHGHIPVDTEAVSAVSTYFYGGAPVAAKEIKTRLSKSYLPHIGIVHRLCRVVSPTRILVASLWA